MLIICENCSELLNRRETWKQETIHGKEKLFWQYPRCINVLIIAQKQKA